MALQILCTESINLKVINWSIYNFLFNWISGSGRYGWWSSETSIGEQRTDPSSVSTEHSSVTWSRITIQHSPPALMPTQCTLHSTWKFTYMDTPDRLCKSLAQYTCCTASSLNHEFFWFWFIWYNHAVQCIISLHL